MSARQASIGGRFPRHCGQFSAYFRWRVRRFQARQIEVDNQHPTGQQAKTLAHELAHKALHWDKDRGLPGGTPTGPLTRSIAELEAESVAYVVCTHFGLDVEVRASRYIALWDGDSKALKASLERIAKTARGIIDDVEAVAGRKAVA